VAEFCRIQVADGRCGNSAEFRCAHNVTTLRDYHTSRFLGEFRRREGFPWSPMPWAIRRKFPFRKNGLMS
jgi:hypothetical protein